MTNIILPIREVKARADGRGRELLIAMGIPEPSLDGKNHPCPKCAGTDRFCLIDTARGACHCRHCMTSDCDNWIGVSKQLLGFNFIDSIKFAARHFGMPWPEETGNGHAGKNKATEAHSKRLVSQIELLPVDRAQAAAEDFARNKPGVDAAACMRANIRAARWPAWEPAENRVDVFAFFGHSPLNGSIKAGLLYRADGQLFGADATKGERKTHLLAKSSKDGLFLIGTAADFRAATVIWVFEGLPDALSWGSSLPPGHFAVSCTCGASAFPPDAAAAFAGKEVRLVYDRDKAGVKGSRKAAECSVGAGAGPVRVPELPAPITADNGFDARDYKNGGATVADLLALAEQTTPISIEAVAATGATGPGKPGLSDAELIRREPRITNCEEVIKETKDGEEKTYEPLDLSDIIKMVQQETTNGIRRVGEQIFVFDPPHGVSWLKKPCGLFGYFQAICPPVHWFDKTRGAVTRSELHSELSRTAPRFLSVESIPHEPPIADHFYACESIEPGNGDALREFLSRFAPETEIDRDLIQAAAMTLIWGGDGGTRPCFVVTAAKGRGKGKSKLAEILGLITGGISTFTAQDEIEKIKTRLLSPEALTTRVALVDNVKSRKFSWAGLEALITTPVISGHAMFIGEGRRPNTLTWFITMNGGALSTDMAQRSVIIKIADPAYSKEWESSIKAFIQNNRLAIIGDLIAALRTERVDLDRHSRWAPWERDVLCRLPEPSEAQKLIRERQLAIDADEEESGDIEDFFANQLVALGYNVDAHCVHIPKITAAEWYSKAVGEKHSVSEVTGIMSQLIHEGRVQLLRENPSRKHGRGFIWAGANVTLIAEVQYDIQTRLEWQANK